MKIRDELSSLEQHTLIQWLSAAAACAKDMPVMFMLDEDGDGIPTEQQWLDSYNIIRNVVCNWSIEPQDAENIARCLEYLLQDFEDTTKYGGDGDNAYGDPLYVYEAFGIEYTPEAVRVIEGLIVKIRQLEQEQISGQLLICLLARGDIFTVYINSLDVGKVEALKQWYSEVDGAKNISTHIIDAAFDLAETLFEENK